MNKLEPYFALSEQFGQGKCFRELINLLPNEEIKKFINNIADTEKQGFERLTNDVCCFYDFKLDKVHGNIIKHNFMDEEGKERTLMFFFANAENLLKIQTSKKHKILPLLKMKDSKKK